jgi:hypothetical protein
VNSSNYKPLLYVFFSYTVISSFLVPNISTITTTATAAAAAAATTTTTTTTTTNSYGSGPPDPEHAIFTSLFRSTQTMPTARMIMQTV